MNCAFGEAIQLYVEAKGVSQPALEFVGVFRVSL
jgi:hypothetical protein